MMQFFSSIRFRRLPLIAMAACLGLCLCASAKESKQFSPATLVEAAHYLPCGEGVSCPATVDTASAFCFRQGDQVLVGEGRSYLHEGKFSSLEEFAGKQLQIRSNRHSLWIKTPDGGLKKINRGSQYENFKDLGCWQAPARTMFFSGTSALSIPIRPRSLAAAGTKTAMFLARNGTAPRPWRARRWGRWDPSIRCSAKSEGWC